MEFERIERLRCALASPVSPRGVGDDAACFGARSTISTDMMVQDVHFRIGWSDWSDVGYKLVASNVSDVLAMGARSEVGTLSFALPRSFSDADFDALVRGVAEGRADWAPGMEIVGGDTTSSPGGAVLSMTIVGQVASRSPWLRAGFVAGDTLWIDGAVGLAAAGLASLSAGDEGDDRGDEVHATASEASPRDALRACALSRCLRAHRRPSPPSWVGLSGWPDARGGVDVSDGLVADLGHAARASGVAFALRGSLPGDETLWATGASLESARGWQLAGGDDYARVVGAPEAPGTGWVAIGAVEAGEGVRVYGADGALLRADAYPGYVHGKTHPTSAK